MNAEKLVISFLAGILVIASPVARGVDYLVTASGPLASINSDAKAFDGTTTTTLPDILDLSRLQGGSFRATYRFTPVAPQSSGTFASYDLSPTSGMISYELLDSSGVVVHRGTNPSDPVALLQNDAGGPPFTVDQVILTSAVNSVTGWHIPAALYSPTPYLSSGADFNVSGYVDNGIDFLPDLSIPTDAATYLSFPLINGGRAFDAFIEFGDGAYQNKSGPYQHAFVGLQYDIASLQVTPAPEPGALTLAAVAGMALVRRRARRVA